MNSASSVVVEILLETENYYSKEQSWKMLLLEFRWQLMQMENYYSQELTHLAALLLKFYWKQNYSSKKQIRKMLLLKFCWQLLQVENYYSQEHS